MEKHFHHFNAAVCVDAAKGWVQLLEAGGKMFVTLAGAMSTAQLGIALAPLIRNGQVAAICCTGANLEEDLFRFVAHSHYCRLPAYRSLKKAEEKALCERGLNRVTDTCIPEERAIRKIERHLVTLWQEGASVGKRYSPSELMYELFARNLLEKDPKSDLANSWLYAAYQRALPIFVPGWEDSTMGNIFVSNVLKGTLPEYGLIKSGLEQMAELVGWYQKTSKESKVGFFQIGGGIAGDFPICVVPLIRQDLEEECPLWSYFCQIGDSTTSYGSYSGANPSEKITWGKLDVNTPAYMIESDATIVAPLIFRYVLEKGKKTS